MGRSLIQNLCIPEEHQKKSKRGKFCEGDGGQKLERQIKSGCSQDCRDAISTIGPKNNKKQFTDCPAVFIYLFCEKKKIL